MADDTAPLIIVLDDDELWLRSLARLLRTRGARSIKHTKPEDVFETLRVERPDLIVIDFLLGPCWDGAKAALRIRAQLGDACPPLILVSGTLGHVTMEQRRPFDAAYPKNMDPTILLDEIFVALEQSREGRPRSHSRLRPLNAACPPVRVRARKQTPS